MLIINILTVCVGPELWWRVQSDTTHSFVSYSAKNYTRPSPPVFHQWTGKETTLCCVKWRLKWRCCQQHEKRSTWETRTETFCWLLPARETS